MKYGDTDHSCDLRQGKGLECSQRGPVDAEFVVAILEESYIRINRWLQRETVAKLVQHI